MSASAWDCRTSNFSVRSRCLTAFFFEGRLQGLAPFITRSAPGLEHVRGLKETSEKWSRYWIKPWPQGQLSPGIDSMKVCLNCVGKFGMERGCLYSFVLFQHTSIHVRRELVSCGELTREDHSSTDFCGGTVHFDSRAGGATQRTALHAKKMYRKTGLTEDCASRASGTLGTNLHVRCDIPVMARWGLLRLLRTSVSHFYLKNISLEPRVCNPVFAS